MMSTRAEPARQPRSPPRAAARTPCCAACSSAAPTPTRRCTRSRTELDARDRALAMRLAYGAVQRKGTLDHLIEGLAERPVARLDPPLLAALRLGLYELLYLGGAPDYAVVADAVELAKTRRPRAGTASSTRSCAAPRARGRTRCSARSSDDTPEQAAVKHSHPEWIARLWWQELGAERRARADGRRQRAGRGRAAREHARHRRRRARGGAPGPHSRPIPTIPEALVLEEPFDVHDSPLWRRARSSRSRARRCSSRACSTHSRASACSTCARRRAARAPTSRR